MKVSITKPGTYAGPQAYDPQITTTKENEVVDVDPNMAAHFVDRGHGKHVTGSDAKEKPAEAGDKKSAKGKS